MNSERPRDAVITVGDRARRAIKVDGVVVLLLEYVACVDITLDGADRGVDERPAVPKSAIPRSYE